MIFFFLVGAAHVQTVPSYKLNMERFNVVVCTWLHLEEAHLSLLIESYNKNNGPKSASRAKHILLLM